MTFDPHHHHEPLPSLLDGLNATLVGGPLKLIAPAAAPAIGRAGQGNLVSLVKLDVDIAGKKNAQNLGRVPLVMTASVFGQGGSGPLVAVARWGSGNGYQQTMEFDVQLGSPEATLIPAPTTGTTLGGQLFSVPGTSFELAVRNDANFIPGVGQVRIGDPSAGDSQATASIGNGNRAGVGGGLTRTVYGFNNTGGAGIAGAVTVAVPAFAKRFRVFRTANPTAPAITVSIQDAAFVTIDGGYAEAAGAPPQTYNLPGAAATVTVTTGAAATIVGCIFELGL